MSQKALIISIQGTNLSKMEKVLLSKEKPWGIILFKRNLKSYLQVKKLIKEIKDLTKNKYFPIIIDEEGGTVSRLQNIINHDFNSKFWGDLYKDDKVLCERIFKHYLISISKILTDLGININTIPVLDILRNNTNKIIGDRSFSKNKYIVKQLGDLTLKYLELNKIGGIAKHIPGHGAAISDSHKKMPNVNLSFNKLNETDFYPFKLNSIKFAMTAHIRYRNLDKKNVATFSKKIIKNIIRKKMKFRGILISDDISMKALKYSISQNTTQAFNAGCDIVLHCNGKYNEMLIVAKNSPLLSSFVIKKTSQLINIIR